MSSSTKGLNMIALLLWVCCTIELVLAQTIIPIGVILPTDTPVTNTSARRVLELTEADINSDPTFSVPNARFRLIWEASSQNKAIPVEKSISLARDQNVVGIIGEYTSDNSAPMALALNSFRVYQCSIATNPDFSDKTVPSDAYQGYAMADIVNSYGWAKVGLITVNSPYGFGLSASFLERAQILGITVLRNEAYNPGDTNYTLQVNSLRDADARIIVLMAFDADVVLILKEARKQGLVDDKHVWIGSDGVETIYGLLHSPESRDSYSNEDRENIEGMVFTTPYEGGGGSQRTALDARYAAAYGADAKIMSYSYFYRDCLLSMALAIKMVVASGISLDRVLNRTTGLGVTEFVAQSFNGSSDRLYIILKLRIVFSSLVQSMVIDAKGSNTSFAKVIFKGGSDKAPADGVVFVRDVIEFTSPLGMTFIALGLIGVIAIAVCLIILVVRRFTAPVKAMSLPFMAIAGFGIMVEFVSVMGWLGRIEEMGGAACYIQQWSGWIGFSLLMQGILPKCYRIYCIFENTRMYSATHLRDKYLLLMSLPITIINVIVLITWQVLDPIRPFRVNENSIGKFHYECQSKDSSLQRNFNIALMTYNGILLMLAMVLAYATRNAASAYRETAYILYAVQNILICGVVVVAIVFSGGTGFTAGIALRNAMALFACYFVLAVLIGRIAMAAVFGDRKGDGIVLRKGKPVKLRFDEDVDQGDAGSDTFLTSSGITEFLIPVRDGGKTFAMWEKRRILYNTSSKLLAILNPNSGVGESLILDSSSSLIPSKLQDCLEVRVGKIFRILQFGNARSLERFVELTLPAMKTSNYSGNGAPSTYQPGSANLSYGHASRANSNGAGFVSAYQESAVTNVPPAVTATVSSDASRSYGMDYYSTERPNAERNSPIYPPNISLALFFGHIYSSFPGFMFISEGASFFYLLGGGDSMDLY
ncbi:periplasmic binding protein-like I [Chytridium lagenaria]|nr:periplasmic binding protein-like I [Chytridium lagenaria]